MAAQTSTLHIRVEDDNKEQATEALTAMGLSVSDAVRLFLRRVVIEQAFPLELKVPNAQTRAAMEESRAMMQHAAHALAMRMNCLPILKKTAASKRATVPRAADYAKAFLKDWQGLSHSGRFDMVRLKADMLLLIANEAPLAPGAAGSRSERGMGRSP
jgi:DNA-damage-inducible protein J